MNAQLDLFNAYVAPEEEPEFRWQRIFPDWMPTVGGYAQFEALIYEARAGVPIYDMDGTEHERSRYVYMGELKIIKIEGNNVDAIGVTRHYYSGCEDYVGKMFYITMHDLWHATYIDETVDVIEVVTDAMIAEYTVTEAKKARK